MSSRLGGPRWLAGLSCAGLAAAVPAQSQSDDTAALAGQRADLEEIIVTAQRRSERLQEVPIAITVQSGAQLERAGVRNLRDLVLVTPGVRIAGASSLSSARHVAVALRT